MERSPWILPGAIVLAGAILAIAIYAVRSNPAIIEPERNPNIVRPVSPEDHLVGNPEAPIILVEYADLDSEFTKQFQKAMAQLMTEYGPTGQVAWVFRHLPLVDMHEHAGRHAEAAECAAELGGEDAFWRFIDLMHAKAPRENEFDPRGYSTLAEQLGIDPQAHEACVQSGRYAGLVEADFKNALDAGADATPYLVLFVDGQDPVTISGSLPYESLKRLIDQKLGQIQR